MRRNELAERIYVALVAQAFSEGDDKSNPHITECGSLLSLAFGAADLFEMEAVRRADADE